MMDGSIGVCGGSSVCFSGIITMCDLQSKEANIDKWKGSYLGHGRPPREYC